MKDWSYFVGNVLVQIRYELLLDYRLILSLLKPRDVGVFWNKKNPVQTGKVS